jgi:hypothetical protein
VILFVANLQFDVDTLTLRKAFEPYGEVVDARIITDRDTGRSRGFGFVEMASEEDALAAIHALDGSLFESRRLTVAVARQRRPAGQTSAAGSPRRHAGGCSGAGRGDPYAMTEPAYLMADHVAPAARPRGTGTAPERRAPLVRLLAAILAADVRDFATLPIASGVTPPGSARAIVGRLHPETTAGHVEEVA